VSRAPTQAERWATNRSLRANAAPTDGQVELLLKLSLELGEPIAVPKTRREASVVITRIIRTKRLRE
jgi:hypothetical protein